MCGIQGDNECTAKGGVCQDWRYNTCTLGYASDAASLCNGDDNRRFTSNIGNLNFNYVDFKFVKFFHSILVFVEIYFKMLFEL